MLRRGLCPRLSFAPFPRRIPPHPARPTFTPRKRTGDARPQTPSARLPLSRQMQAMPASAACLPPASRRQIFCPPFPRAGCFCSFSLRCACIHLCRDACESGKRDRCAAAQTYSPFCAPFSRFERTFPLFRTAKIILSLPPSFVAAQKTAFAEQSPLSESAASKNTAAEPAAQDEIPFKTLRQKTRPPNPRHKTESRLKRRVKKHGRRTRGTTAHF